MSADRRQALADAQAKLARALCAGEAMPVGFEASQVNLVARSLANKRRRTVAKTWPVIATTLGDAFVDWFDRYAAANPAIESPLEDGANFARFLQRHDQLSDGGRVELFHYSMRRRPAGMIRLGEFGRVILAIYLPTFGVRTMTLPWPKRKLRGRKNDSHAVVAKL